jgi:hypothetical protein
MTLGVVALGVVGLGVLFLLILSEKNNIVIAGRIKDDVGLLF